MACGSYDISEATPTASTSHRNLYISLYYGCADWASQLQRFVVSGRIGGSMMYIGRFVYDGHVGCVLA